MAPKKRTLDKMRDNPKADWTIGDVEKVAKQEDIEVRSPTGGSHYVLSSPRLRDPLCVPHNRPIKPRYIRLLVSYVRAHRVAGKSKGASE